MFQRKAPKPPPSMALPGFERDIEANKESAAEDKENPVARSVGDLIDEMKKLPKADKGTMLDRVSTWTKDTIDESVGRSQKTLEKVPGAFQKAWAWSKATTAAMVHDYLHPLEETD
jgi:hypothetical protein